MEMAAGIIFCANAVMEQIFHKIIIWDFNRTIYDPDARALIKDAMDVLIYAHQKGYKGILFSKNKAGEMPIKEQLNKLAISEYFQAVIESEEKNIKDIKQLLFLALLPNVWVN